MFLKPQRVILSILLLILAFGLVCLYSSCHQKGVFIKEEIFNKQILWAGVGLCFLFLMSKLDYHRLGFIVAAFYILTFFSLVFVLVSGRIIMGAQRWISLGEVSFQPSEFGKFALILFLSYYFSRQACLNAGGTPFAARLCQSLLFPLGASLLLASLVLIQPDLGTAVVYLFLFFSTAFLAGVRRRYLLSLLIGALAAFPLFWHFLKDYQKSRLLVFLNPNIDPLGAGYTIIQSKIAIGSGRLFGKGWMAGTQSQLNFLAERHTDFIFSVIGEEWGFIGGLALLVLFGVLIFMILEVAGTAKDSFGRLLCSGVAALIFFHVFINIAMNIGMCPVVGIPLPFISYGGSSLVINLAGLGIVLSVARQR